MVIYLGNHYRAGEPWQAFNNKDLIEYEAHLADKNNYIESYINIPIDKNIKIKKLFVAFGVPSNATSMVYMTIDGIEKLIYSGTTSSPITLDNLDVEHNGICTKIRARVTANANTSVARIREVQVTEWYEK